MQDDLLHQDSCVKIGATKIMIGATGLVIRRSGRS